MKVYMAANGSKMSNHIYIPFSFSDKGSISIHYSDFTDDNSTTELATVTCRTRRFHPESVLWLRNGELLSTDGHNYETVQILNDRSNSFYENKLIIRDTVGLVNDPTYTCEVSHGNTTLTRNTIITIGITGTLKIMLGI